MKNDDERHRREAAHSQPAEVLPGGHEVKPRSFRQHWDDPKKHQRTTMLSVRVSPEELQLIETAAQWREMTVSAYLRDRALDGAHINYKITRIA